MKNVFEQYYDTNPIDDKRVSYYSASICHANKVPAKYLIEALRLAERISGILLDLQDSDNVSQIEWNFIPPSTP